MPVERPDPVPGPEEVLIRVAGAGVNRPDVLQRRGAYPPPPGASDIPGLEVSGTIAAVGAGVRQWKVDDAVCALVRAAATRRCAWRPRSNAFRCRRASTSSLRPAIPETFFTVWTNVFDRGRLRAGETALFHGGASGIGTTAIQLAAARGATVLATAGSDEKCRACEDLGAKQAINYRTADFVEAVRELTGGKGVDLILDMVGGSYVGRNLEALATDGRLVQIGFMSGESTAPVDFRRVLSAPADDHRLDAPAEDGGGKGADCRRAPDRGLAACSIAASSNRSIHRVFPLAQAADAHRLMESSEHVGKIVLGDINPGRVRRCFVQTRKVYDER